MTVPFALSIHNFVNSVGSYVGFASIVAVAILILLYFAHARETATLRDRLDEAQQRIAGFESRIAQLMQMQTAQRGRVPAPIAPAPVAPPVPVRAPGAPQGSVRRVPNPATAAGGAAAAAGAAATAAQPAQTAVPSAPAGVGGPALASATRMIPDPAAPGAPDDTMFVPAAAAAAANGKAQHTAVLPPATPAPAAAAAASAGAGAASASPRGVAAPPRVQLGAEQEAAAATAAGGGKKVRRIGGHPDPAPVSLPTFDDESVGGRFSGVLLPLLIGGIAVAVIVAGLVVITNSNNSTTGNVSHGNNSGATGQALHTKQTTPVPFSAANVTVAVLNGTAQSGLAGAVGKRLSRDGYKQGNVTNASSQTQPLTQVYFVRGKQTKANRIAARHVAKALSLPATRVHGAGAGSSVLQSCAISATGSSLGSCGASVIVSVGQDRVNLASG